MKHFTFIARIFRNTTKLTPAAALMLPLAVSFAACNHIDDKRTPPAPVWISFNTEHDWTEYGTPGALDHKTFIKGKIVPGGLPQTALMQTGFGGVLLVGDISGQPVSYELSCPVENSKNILIEVDDDTNDAFCPKCKSRYSIYTNYGQPLSGPAAENDYGLTKYYVGPGPNGEYRVITR